MAGPKKVKTLLFYVFLSLFIYLHVLHTDKLTLIMCVPCVSHVLLAAEVNIKEKKNAAQPTWYDAVCITTSTSYTTYIVMIIYICIAHSLVS